MHMPTVLWSVAVHLCVLCLCASTSPAQGERPSFSGTKAEAVATNPPTQPRITEYHQNESPAARTCH
jgi:hypothetical protein